MDDFDTKAPNRFRLFSEIRSVEELLFALFQNSPVGTLLIDDRIRLIDANKFMFRYFNKTEELVYGKLFGNTFNCNTVDEKGVLCGSQPDCQTCLIRNSLNNVITNGIGFEGIELEHQFRLNGRTDKKWFSVSATPVKHQNEIYAVVTMVDISEIKRREETLVRLGITDELTGLYNRRFIMEKLKKELDQLVQPDNSLVVAILDIDNFKKVNDNYGHLTGDDVLKALSEILKSGIRYTDFAGRYGGEEFIVLIPNSSEQIGRRILENISARLSVLQIDSLKEPVTFSAGLVEVTRNIDCVSEYDCQEILSKADKLLYIAKANGKNRIESEKN